MLLLRASHSLLRSVGLGLSRFFAFSVRVRAIHSNVFLHCTSMCVDFHFILRELVHCAERLHMWINATYYAAVAVVYVRVNVYAIFQGKVREKCMH